MSQVTGKLSNRVMNMKFMRFANKSGDSEPSAGEANSDGSAKFRSGQPESTKAGWSLKRQAVVAPAEIKVIRVRRNVDLDNQESFTSIRGPAVIRGRRMLEPEKEEPAKRKSDSIDEENDAYEPDLDQLFKSSKQPANKKNDKKKNKKRSKNAKR